VVQFDFEFAVTNSRQVSADKFRVLVVDDYPSMQQALVACLEAVENLEVVGTAGNGEDDLLLALELHTDIFIAVMHMPIMDGFQLTR
jgi:DNA-binding NarL/FixJ family response regulator